MTARTRLLSRYSLAVLAVLLAAALHAALDPLWGGRNPFVPFYPAVVFVAWFAGLGPGLLATLLSALVLTRVWPVPPPAGPPGHLLARALLVGADAPASLRRVPRD